jgi:hypothetical protein
MNGFAIAPLHNTPGDNDATGAFHIGARTFTRALGLPAPVFFQNQGSPGEVYRRFLRELDAAPGPWDAFAYFGHGDNTCLPSAHIYNRAGARLLAGSIRAKANQGVVVLLYACNTGVAGGFAQWLAEELADVGGVVYAHLPPPGHSFTNPMLVSYPGGEWVIPRSHRLYREWCHHLKDERGDLFARFAFMTEEELEGELEAPRNLMGRWQLRGPDGAWDVVFFPDKVVVGTDEANRFQINGVGTWSATRSMLTIEWSNGDSEAWPLALSLRGQNVRFKGADGAMKALKATRTESPEMNPQMIFRARAELQHLIDI